jgi:hypothetical protein
METDGLIGSTIDIPSSITAVPHHLALPASGNVTISTTSSGSFGSVSYGNASSYLYNPIISTGTAVLYSTAGLYVSSDAEFDGDIKWKGRSLSTLLEKIEDRLAILAEPDPEKLEKFAALKKAYDNYKLLEKLIGE